MSCTNPMLMVCVEGKNLPLDWRRFEKQGFKFNESKTKGYKLTNKQTRNLELEKISSWVNQELIEVPCGKCIQCQLDKAKDWAIRCTHEASLYKHNYFITLTYDDAHLPKSPLGNATLVPDELRQFLKSVRQKFKRDFKHTGVRFIACGEYNSSGSRMLNPHYHLILFNAPIPGLTIDLPGSDETSIIHQKNGNDEYMMWSKWIQELWSDSDGNWKGSVRIDSANYNTESYVSRYILKKQTGENYDVYTKTFGVVAPFFRCSNRPGIGLTYCENNIEDLLDNPSLILSRPVKGSIVTGLPRYYKKKLFELFPSSKQKFIDKAKEKSKDSQLVRKFQKTTVNAQRCATEKHFESLKIVHQRNFE